MEDFMDSFPLLGEEINHVIILEWFSLFSSIVERRLKASTNGIEHFSRMILGDGWLREFEAAER